MIVRSEAEMYESIFTHFDNELEKISSLWSALGGAAAGAVVGGGTTSQRAGENRADFSSRRMKNVLLGGALGGGGGFAASKFLGKGGQRAAGQVAGAAPTAPAAAADEIAKKKQVDTIRAQNIQAQTSGLVPNTPAQQSLRTLRAGPPLPVPQTPTGVQGPTPKVTAPASGNINDPPALSQRRKPLLPSGERNLQEMRKSLEGLPQAQLVDSPEFQQRLTALGVPEGGVPHARLEQAKTLARDKVKGVSLPKASDMADPAEQANLFNQARQALQSYSFDPELQATATALMKRRLTNKGYDAATVARAFA